MKARLIEKLKEQTKEVYSEYLIKVEEWADEQVKSNIKKMNEYIRWNNSNEPRNPNYYKLQKLYHGSSINFNKAAFTVRAIKDAKIHYEVSTEKLASRILEKNINIEKIEVRYAKVGVNIETVFTDGKQSIRAFTILAAGPVQRPHYRYLIK